MSEIDAESNGNVSVADSKAALEEADKASRYKFKKTPERGGSPIKRLAQLKRLLNKLKNNIEVVVEPSCLVLDPTWYNVDAYSVMFFFLEMSEYEGYEDSIDLAYLNSLFEKGADIKAVDKLGQTILHDVARCHRVTTARYFLRSGADINRQDCYGRTPLHIAAKRDYDEMVKLFIEHGANVEIVTNGACLTPLHCAAMGDAPNAITTLLKADCNKENTDYRGRTALLIACEFDRRSATSKLIELEASARVVDYTGLHALSLLIDRMPKLAYQALDQCFTLDKKSRELKVWLNYMEPDLLVPKDARYGFSLVDEISKSSNSELVQHPAVKALIDVKWNQFGQRSVIKDIGMYLIYLLAWSLLMILTPLTPPSKSRPHAETRGTQRLITEATAYIFYIAFVLEEINEARQGHIQQAKWKNMRMGQVQSDLKVLRPISETEKQFLNNELEKARKTTSMYFSDYWNIYDWCTYGLQFFGIVVYLYCEIIGINIDVHDDEMRESYFKIFRIRSQLMSIAILLSWFKVFKYVRVFKSMGPFVVIITHSIGDVAKIAFVYCILYVPMVCIFYQFYGNRGLEGYEGVQDTMFTVFRMIVVDDYSYTAILGKLEEPHDHHEDEHAEVDLHSHNHEKRDLFRVKRKGNSKTSDDDDYDEIHEDKVIVDRWWTRFLVAYWIIVSSVILLNLFIALMSDTFQRVYDNAIGVASLERAESISGLEVKLNKKSRDRYLKDLQDNYSPLVRFHDEGGADEEANEEMVKLDELDEKISKLEEKIEYNSDKLQNDLYDMQERNMVILHSLDDKITEMYLRDHGRRG